MSNTLNQSDSIRMPGNQQEQVVVSFSSIPRHLCEAIPQKLRMGVLSVIKRHSTYADAHYISIHPFSTVLPPPSFGALRTGRETILHAPVTPLLPQSPLKQHHYLFKHPFIDPISSGDRPQSREHPGVSVWQVTGLSDKQQQEVICCNHLTQQAAVTMASAATAIAASFVRAAKECGIDSSRTTHPRRQPAAPGYERGAGGFELLPGQVHPWHQPAVPSQEAMQQAPTRPVVVTQNPMVKSQVCYVCATDSCQQSGRSAERQDTQRQ